MSAVIVDINRKKLVRKCYFCKVPESNVKTLIKSRLNDHCICGDCIRKVKKVSDETVVEEVES